MRPFQQTFLIPALYRCSLSVLLFGILATIAPLANAWDASGRFDSNGNYLDPASGHTAACLRYESGFVAPATIGGLVNGLEVEKQSKIQLAGAHTRASKTGFDSSLITIEPNVLPPQHTTRWMIHTSSGHTMIGVGQ